MAEVPKIYHGAQLGDGSGSDGGSRGGGMGAEKENRLEKCPGFLYAAAVQCHFVMSPFPVR
jgi:hypothetical protein